MPHALQRALGLSAALLLSPVMAGLAIAIRMDSPGPALHRASRVGRDGRVFTCLKLRTMRVDSVGPAITLRDDPRVTRLGRFLRRFRLDELPQLWHVARGEMLLVGPRPEDPRYVDFADPVHARVFRATPGITGLAQLAYSDEASLLAEATDPEQHYRDVVLPGKLALDIAYLEQRSWRLDVEILARTAGLVLRPSVRTAGSSR